MPNYRSMKKIIKIIALISLVFSLTIANVVLAAVIAKQTLAPGTLFKFKGDAAVYFVASDATAYPFPDQETFFSWYPSFNKVKVYEKNTIANATSKLLVTMKPGARVIKFGNDPKLYAVSQGAKLRWIVTEKVLTDLFGSSWRNYYEQLPPERLREYSISDKITDAKNFNRAAERTNVTISQELNRRKILNKETIAIDGSIIPLFKSLTEDVSGAFSPAFKPTIFYYTLKTKFSEDRITFTPVVYDSFMTVKVKDYTVEAGKSITIDIPSGDSDIPLYVFTPDGRVNTYTVRVSRIGPNNDYNLSSLTENLNDTLWPTFKPNLFVYSVRAKETENKITIKATPKDPKARLVIDNKDFSASAASSGYEKTLVKGLNTIQIQVIAENGASIKYTVEIQKPI